MAFNVWSIKKLSAAAGVNRVSQDSVVYIQTLVNNQLKHIIQCLVDIILFCGKKTLTVDDLLILKKVCPGKCPAILIAPNFNHYKPITPQKPFKRMVYKMVQEVYSDELRVSGNLAIVLQAIFENYLMTLIHDAGQITNLAGRNTLFVDDVKVIQMRHSL